jgi:hypothetical protein
MSAKTNMCTIPEVAYIFMFSKPEAADVCQDLHDCSIDQKPEEAPIFVLSKLDI